MSELPGNFPLEDWMTLDAEQGSSTNDHTFFPPLSSMPNYDFTINGMDLDFEIPKIDWPADNSSIPMGGFINPLDLHVNAPSEPTNFHADTGLYDISGSSFNSFGTQDMNQFGPAHMRPQMSMPPMSMFAPQYPCSDPYNYQPPPGFMLVPISQSYPQQPIMTPTSPVIIDEAPVPSKRRVARPKQPKQPPPELSASISVLTKGFSAPIKDMMAHASRSTATRHAEAKNAGKILRPYNRFMMYRAAYADRTKQFASVGSHQDVSRILGVSWKLESEDINEHFSKCAALDHGNHQKAFPDYRYAPTAHGARAGRTRGSKRTRDSRTPQPDSDDDMTTPEPKKKKKQPSTPKITLRDEDILPESDDETDPLFADTPKGTRKVTHPTPSKYNLRCSQVLETILR
ncbi:hypothetical protein E4T39_06236 [Aureobasidium subglaciale]|nr:hypothetical protein E4T39_06236 [Aureobasidium subglaciale]